MDILYRDADIVVAVKPYGVLSEFHETQACMPRLLGGEVYPVHRLDRVVGGVMVYARNRAAAAKLSAAVQQQKLDKVYTAIVSGAPLPAQGELRDFLLKVAAQNKSFVVDCARRGAKEAVLTYTTEGSAEQDGTLYTRVKIRLQTGRSHQIRVQFSSRGWPLVGDGKYGSRQKVAQIALFATALSFPHPKTGKILHFSAPVPGDFPWSLFGSAAYEIERKFLIVRPDEHMLRSLPDCRVRRIEQTYLTAPAGETHRVRRIEENGACAFVETRKYRVSALRATEEERTLTPAEYEALVARADATRIPVCKTRYCVPHAGHVIEVDVYDFWQKQATAEVELSSESEGFTLPPFLQVLREVTDDVRYKNVNLAKEIPPEE